jgi:hypothetical protein
MREHTTATRTRRPGVILGAMSARSRIRARRGQSLPSCAARKFPPRAASRITLCACHERAY